MSEFTVRHGRRYRATISLGLLEQLAGNDLIAEKLRAAGFAEVEVSGRGGTRTAVALWPSEDRSAPLPPQVTSVVELA
jgi:hypothetical protein